MNKYVLVLIIILSADLVSFAQLNSDPMASPVQTGAYIPGMINIRDYANPGTSGLMFVDYNLFFSTNKFMDQNGNQVNEIDAGHGYGPFPIDVEMSGYINSLLIAYTSQELNFLGHPRYMAMINPYYATADFRVTLSNLPSGEHSSSGGTGGIGDLGITPLLLCWSGADDKFDITSGYTVTAPTGRYKTGADDNIGLGYWSHLFQLFTYYYPLPMKATALMLGNSYEVHGKIKDLDVKAGSRYTLEYGISQYLSERLEVIAQGGHIWQVGKDSGSDVYWDPSIKDRYSTVGLGMGYWPVKEKFYLNFKWYTNYGIKQSFKQNNFELQLIYIPGIMVGIADKK